MRVLMVAHRFLPDSRGGMENHAFSLSKYLGSVGHEVGVLYRVRSPRAKGYTLEKGEWDGLRTFKLVGAPAVSRPDPYPFYSQEVEDHFGQVLAAFQPDLVHFHHLVDLSASLLAVTSRNAIPTVFTLHDFWPMCFMSHLRTPDELLCPGPDEGLRCVECLWKQQLQAHSSLNMRARYRELGLRESMKRLPRFLADALFARLAGGNQEFSNANLRTQMVSLAVRNSYMRSALRGCDLLISPSRFLMAKFVEWGVPASHFRHIYNSVPGNIRSLRSSPREPRDHVRFGFLGSLYPPKGVHVLIEAFKQLNSDQAELHIWGDAPNPGAQAYADQIREQGRNVANLAFEGGFAPGELPGVLRQTDVLVVPSTWYENNPLVILEAFAAGIPVLAGDIGGMAEMVQDDLNGLQYRTGDARDLAVQMGRMLDRSRLQRYRAHTMLPASHEQMGAEVEQLYKELLGGRHSPPFRNA